MKVLIALEDVIVSLQSSIGMVRNERLLLVYEEQVKALQLLLTQGYELFNVPQKSFDELKKARSLSLLWLDFKGSMAADKNHVLLKANEFNFRRLEGLTLNALYHHEGEIQRNWLEQTSHAAAKFRDQLHVVRLTRF